jgi:hypothetical protein
MTRGASEEDRRYAARSNTNKRTTSSPSASPQFLGKKNLLEKKDMK